MSLNNNRKKHIKFIERHLALLPGSHEAQDVNKMAIVFYAIESLCALEIDTKEIYTKNLGWIHKHYSKISLENDEPIAGFVGSLTMDIAGVNTISLPNTLFALLTLLILDDRAFLTDSIEMGRISSFVSACQLEENGSFMSALNFDSIEASSVDSNDLRFCYIAVTILYLCGSRTINDFSRYIDTEKLVEFISSQKCNVGGFGQYGEPHAGYTSCALSALKLLDSLDRLSEEFIEKSITWLVQRQVSNIGCSKFENENNASYDEFDHGGFQGRENKFADTCYVFWCLNSLQILTPDWQNLCNTSLVRDFLLNRTQNLVTGGFSKNDEDDPDLYHTCLGIASLKLIDESFNGVLCIPKNISSSLES